VRAMAITTKRKGNIEIIFPLNDLDSINGQEIKSHLHQIISEIDAVIINFSKVSYLNSSGLRELIQTLKLVQDNNKKIFLTNIVDNIKKIFINTNLHKLFSILENEDEALSRI
jgi:anti-sigma B factor antagonist